MKKPIKRLGKTVISLLVLAAATAPLSAQAQELSLRTGGIIPPDVDSIYERGLAWLVKAQSPEGQWKDNRAGCGVDGICLMALLASGEDPNYGRYAATIR